LDAAVRPLCAPLEAGDQAFEEKRSDESAQKVGAPKRMFVGETLLLEFPIAR